MEIIIQGRQAVLKKGTSFDFIAENRLFTDSDSYTLSMVFPLAGCAQNLQIFGHLERKDVSKERVVYDCEIRHLSMVRVGVITITEINEAEVKTQFLEGRSAQNFDLTFDNIFINELNLGSPGFLFGRNVTPMNMWTVREDSLDFVALPWVNSYSGNIQNEARYDSNHGNYTWVYKTGNTQATMKLSCQPFLIYLVKNMCAVLGYSYDFSQWQQSPNKFLLVCNALPAAWDTPAFARALPHWTVTEFFAQLELLLNGEFDIDHQQRKVTFRYTINAVNEVPKVFVRNVIDKYKVEVKKEEQDNFRLARLKQFAECDHEAWKFYSCTWLVNALRNEVVTYATMNAFFTAVQDLRTVQLSVDGEAQIQEAERLHRIYYVTEADTYFAFRNTAMTTGTRNGQRVVTSRTYAPVPINIFGNRSVTGADGEKTAELKMVPAWMDETDEEHGFMLFLSMANYEEKADVTDLGVDEIQMVHPGPLSMLAQGEQNGMKEYFDKIYLAYWDGEVPQNEMPMPCVDRIMVDENWRVRYFDYSLRFDDRCTKRLPGYVIDRKKKYTFSFLADNMPDVRAVFCIEGMLYLCEKMTATFTETGMSRLIKGTFWRINS